MQIDVSEDDILWAESVLLRFGKHFDEERREFIKNLRTIDLQAVPGSGKTTALLAKLIILEKKMPLPGNSGILVISHTNAAVDEIKSRLGHISPKLFSFPNFIGTIQSFVDTFFAIPYYKSRYKQSMYCIDDDFYLKHCKLKQDFSLASWLSHKDPDKIFLSLELNENDELLPIKELKNRQSHSFVGLQDIKRCAIRQGILHFNEMFSFARNLMKETPSIVDILNQRFGYIFVDEMQDMKEEQFSLLDEIFKNSMCYQRIGDSNQTIFSKKNVCSSTQTEILKICGSHRLSPTIANIVQRFAINKQTIEGRNKNDNGSEINIKPIIIVYTEKNITNVIDKYAEIISCLKKKRKLPASDSSAYWAAGWVNDNDRADIVKIDSYYPHYMSKKNSSRFDYDTLDAYLRNIDLENRNFASIYEVLLDVIIKVLRLEGVKIKAGFVTKRMLMDFVRESQSVYDKFKQNLYNWCELILSNKIDDLKKAIKAYLPELLGNFSKNLCKSLVFLDGQAKQQRKSIKNQNEVLAHGEKISIYTIHSVKGKTCTGLLYLETFKGNGRSRDVYESQKLAAYLKGKCVADEIKKSSGICEAAKMMYVGFSRPTHLLCFAVEKNRFEENLKGFVEEEWDVVELK